MLKIVKHQLHSWWWPVPLKTPVFIIDRSSVATSRFYRLKKTLNVLGAKKNNFIFCVFKVLQYCYRGYYTNGHFI